MEFRLLEWSAWADGLATPQDWLDWAQAPVRIPAAGRVPELTDVPAMTRRRLGRLGRLSFAATQAVHRGDAPLPLVLASRYGDAERSLEQLAQLVGPQGDVSPTGFGLSVHNAIGAIYSIARGLRANISAVAAAGETAAAGLVEALALLDEGAPEVVVVCYDEDLPGPYGEFQDSPVGAWAWAWRIAPADRRHERFSLRAAQGAPIAASMPDGLELLRFVLSGESGLEQRHAQRAWQWRRHAPVH
jgi:hypothetical protein